MARGSVSSYIASVAALLVQLQLSSAMEFIAASTSTSTTTHRALQQGAASDNNAFALYSLAPFTVTFTSLYDTAGLPEDLVTDPDYLASTLNRPLKLITSEFLVESFRVAIAANDHVQQGFSSNNIVSNRSPYNTTTDEAMQRMLNNFMTLDLQVAVYQSDHVTLRDTGSAYKGNEGQHNGRQRRKLQTAYEAFPESPYNSYSHTSGTHRRLQFRAEFFTTAAFLEDNTDADEPSKELVAHLLGTWIGTAFEHDKDYYQQMLHNSEEAILQHVDALQVETDSQATYDPYATTTGGGGVHLPQSGSTNNAAGSGSGTDTNASNTSETWTLQENIYFSLLIATSVLSLSVLLFLLHRHQRKKAMEDQELNHIMTMDGDVDWGSSSAGMTGGGNDYNPALLSIGGRHSDEVMDILNASDRYLAAHRPDLLQAIQQQEQGSTIIAVPNEREDGGTAGPVVERRYVTPTNPFAYLYGASFFHRERDAVEHDQKQQRRRRWLQNRIFDPMAGVELDARNSFHGPRENDDEMDEGIIVVDDDEDMDDDLERASAFSNEQSGADATPWAPSMTASPIKTFFTNMWGLAQARSHHQDDDDVEGDSDEEYYDGYEDYQGDDEANQSLACDEDPQTYSFPYQDFPRQDGTPCLIYEELDEEAEEQLLKEGGSGRRNSTKPFGVTRGISTDSTDSVPLSNSEFQRALSQRALEVDDRSVDGLATSYEDESVSSNPHFTDKLERLIAVRHRHYEKERIMENHREQRRREREQKRQQEQEELQRRDRLLRRHSIELDIQELEAGLASGALNSTKASNAVTPQSKASWDALDQYGSDHENPRSVAAKWLAGGSKENNGIDRTFSAGGIHQSQPSWHPDNATLQQVHKPQLHRRTSSEAQMGDQQAALEAEARRILDHDGVLPQKSLQHPIEPRIVQSARKPRRPQTDVFRSVEAPAKTPVVPLSNAAMISPSESLTSSTSSGTSGLYSHTPPLSASSNDSHNYGRGAAANRGLMLPLSSGSVRDGSSARKKLRTSANLPTNSHASAALAAGYQHRRTMSFGRYEEKKTAEAEDKLQQIMNNQEPPRIPTQQVNGGGRSMTPNRHRRSHSGTPADNVMLHGIYAQFV